MKWVLSFLMMSIISLFTNVALAELGAIDLNEDITKLCAAQRNPLKPNPAYLTVRENCRARLQECKQKYPGTFCTNNLSSPYLDFCGIGATPSKCIP